MLAKNYALATLDIFSTDEEIIDMITERYRRRTAWHKAEKNLILQGKAICRRLLGSTKEAASDLFDKIRKLKDGEIEAILANDIDPSAKHNDLDLINGVWNVYPIIYALNYIEKQRLIVEAEYSQMVKRLPIASWVKTQDGVSWGSIAAIIGSTGDLRHYANPSRVWKRMGLAVMPDGRQRPMRDAERAKTHGYNPQRRSVMWNIGTSILRTQTEKYEDEIDPETGEFVRDAKGKKIKTDIVKKPAGEWRILYDQRRAYEEEKNANGDYADQAAQRLREANFAKTTSAYKLYSEGKLPPLHLHARAQRFMEKRFLLQMWKEWNAVMPPLPEETVGKTDDVAEAEPEELASP